MTTLVWLAATAALAALVGAAPYAPHALHALGLAALTGLYVYVWWRARRRNAALYHRHRFERARCHARPTRTHRARLAVARLRHLHLTTARTA